MATRGRPPLTGPGPRRRPSAATISSKPPSAPSRARSRASRRVADQLGRVGRPDERRVAVARACSQSSTPARRERRGHEVAHASGRRRSRRRSRPASSCARGAHHRVDVVGRPAPVAAGVEVAQRQLVGSPRGDRAPTVAVILRVTKRRRAARRLVVVEDHARRVQAALRGRRRPSGARRPSPRRTGSTGRIGGVLVLRATVAGSPKISALDACTTRTVAAGRSCSGARPRAARRAASAVDLARCRSGSSHDWATELIAGEVVDLVGRDLARPARRVASTSAEVAGVQHDARSGQCGRAAVGRRSTSACTSTPSASSRSAR